MAKREEVIKFLNENKEDNIKKDKSVLIESILKSYKLTKSTATTYYYEWKKEYMNSKNCVPRKEKEPVKSIVKEKPRAKFIIEEPKISEKRIIKEGCIKQSMAEEKKCNLKVENMTIKGKFGTYSKTEEGVTIGELFIRNVDDLEKYKSECLSEVYERLGEIADVLEVEVWL